MNLGKSAVSFSESDLDKFIYLFILEDAIIEFIFCWSCTLRPTTESNLYWECTKEGNPFALAKTGIQ